MSTTTSSSATKSLPTSAITRTILATVPLHNLPGYESRLALLEYPPGFHAPLHNHPVAATGYVLSGSVISQWEGGEIEQYKTGDHFVDLGETVHVRSENASQTEWLRLLNNYVIKIGEPNAKMLE